MFSLLKLIVKTVIVLALVAVLVLGYMGFVPGISKIFGSDKPKNLGVTYETKDFETYVQKVGMEFESLDKNLAPEKSLSFSGKVNLDASFTGKEITAMVNNDKWKYYPVSNVQIKINPDNTVEASGVLRLDRLVNYAKAQKISQKDIDAAMEYLKYVKTNPPFYAKGTGSILDNKVSLKLEQITIGKLNLPDKLIQNSFLIAGFVEDRISFVPNFTIKNLSFENGSMKVLGTYPAVQYNSEN